MIYVRKLPKTTLIRRISYKNHNYHKIYHHYETIFLDLQWTNYKNLLDAPGKHSYLSDRTNLGFLVIIYVTSNLGGVWITLISKWTDIKNLSETPEKHSYPQDGTYLGFLLIFCDL